nr:unnamed protein product [Spirometra erinaceieuropaei]
MLKTDDDVELYRDDEKAEHLCKFFQSVFTREVAVPTDHCNVDNVPIIDLVVLTKPIAQQEIVKLKEGTSPGPDEIPAKMLKELATELAGHLSLLFQASLDAGRLPPEWKTAWISPIHKSGSRASANNYRPHSAEVTVTSGVPQGSLLGPILFLIYIDDCIHGLDCKIAMFADDIKLWTVIRNEDDEANLQANLDRLEKCLCVWHSVESLLEIDEGYVDRVPVVESSGPALEELQQSCPSLNDIRLAQEIKDLTIEVKGGDVLHTHRVVLADRVPSLRANLSGFPGNDDYALKWPTVSLSLATAFIQYVYTGQVKLTESNVKDMIMLARILKIPNRVNWGTSFMANRTFASNMGLCQVSEYRATDGYLRQSNEKRFEDFVTTEHFVRLPAENVLSLLRSNDLSVRSEDKVIGAIARWVDHADDVHDERLNVERGTVAPNDD